MTQRVLHLAWDGGLGGVQRYLLKVVGSPHWQQTEHAICFFTEAGEVINQDTLGHVKQYAMKIRRGFDFHLNHRLKAIIQEFQPDVIHCHCDTPAFIPQLIRASGTKLVFHEHGDTIMRRKRSWATSIFWKVFGHRWAKVITNSDFVRRDFVARYPALTETCDVLHNPLLEQCQVDERKGDHPVIAVFARMEWQKGVDRIVEQMPALLVRCPDLELRFYGHGSMEQGLRDRIKELGCEHAVNFVGYVSDPLEKMAEVDLVVIPSRIEPFGLVAVEAQSMGTPVVAFDQTGVVETVKHEETGIIVPQESPEMMVEAISSLLKDGMKRKRLGHNARIHAREHFSLAGHNARLEAVYNGL